MKISSSLTSYSLRLRPCRKLAHSKQVFLLPTQKTDGIPTTNIIRYFIRNRTAAGWLICFTWNINMDYILAKRDRTCGHLNGNVNIVDVGCVNTGSSDGFNSSCRGSCLPAGGRNHYLIQTTALGLQNPETNIYLLFSLGLNSKCSV